MSGRKRNLAISALLICVSISTLLALPGAISASGQIAGFKPGWTIPVGSPAFPSFSPDGKLILLPALYDGYYFYDSSGTLLHRLPDQYALLGSFSTDANRVLLAREVGGRPTVSLLDRNTMMRSGIIHLT